MQRHGDDEVGRGLFMQCFEHHVGERLGEMQAMLILVTLQHGIHRVGIAEYGDGAIERGRGSQALTADQASGRKERTLWAMRVGQAG